MTTRESFMRLALAAKHLGHVIATELHLYKFMDWISEKMNNIIGDIK